MTLESAPWLRLVGGQRSAASRFLNVSQGISAAFFGSVIWRWDDLDPWTRLIWAIRRQCPSSMSLQSSLVNHSPSILQSPQHHTLPYPRQPQTFRPLPQPPLQPPLWVTQTAPISTSRSVISGRGSCGDAALTATASAAQPLATGDLLTAPGPTTPPTLLLVHPRYRGIEDQEEALRLAESLVGQRCPFLEVGGSRLRARRPREASPSPPFTAALRRPMVSGLRATYFGSGTMVDLARRLDELEAAESVLGSRAGLSERQKRQGQLEGEGQDGPGEVGDGAAASVQNIAADGGYGSAGRRRYTRDNTVIRPGGAASGGGSSGGTAGGGSSGLRATAFINEVLTPLQERNIELGLGRPVVDRVGLILRLFAQRAHTREARLQVELASLSYMLPRLVRVRGTDGRREAFGVGSGWGGLNPDLGPALQVVSARQRGTTGAGGLGGGGGSGDPELRQQRFRIKQRLATLRAELKAVAASRGIQRQGRRAAGLPTIAIVGYTNVGKTSLAAAMCSRDAGLPPPTDMLFATLDPAVRRAWLPTHGSHVAVSDTVGFIRDLPVGLVAAFRATLEEVVAADMLVHVLDASSPNVAQQRDSVLAVLQQLGVSEHVLTRRIIEVWNKIDLLCQPRHHGTAGHHEVRQLEGVRHKYGSDDVGYSASGNYRSTSAASAGWPIEQTAPQAAAVAEYEEENDLGEEEEEEEVEEEEVDTFQSSAAMCNNSEDWDHTDRYSPRYDGLTGGGGTATVVSWNKQRGRDEQLHSPADAGGNRYVVSDDELNGNKAAAVSGDVVSELSSAARAAARAFISHAPVSERPMRRLFADGTRHDGGAPSTPATVGSANDGERMPPPPPGRPPPGEGPLASPLQPPPPSSSFLPSEGKPSTRGLCYTAAAADAGVRMMMTMTMMARPPVPPPSDFNGTCSFTREHRSRAHSAAGNDEDSRLRNKAELRSGTNIGTGIESGTEAAEGMYTAGGTGSGAETNWLNPKCLATAADLVRQVHGTGSCVPAAVVLAAVAEDGGGVAEVKAAVDAVLRTVSALSPPPPPQQQQQQPAGTTLRRTRVGRHDAREPTVAADASKSRQPPVAAAAAAVGSSTAGRWASPLLWLADGVLWPPPPPSGTDFASTRRRGITAAGVSWACSQGPPSSGAAANGDVGRTEAVESPARAAGAEAEVMRAAASRAEAGDQPTASSHSSLSSWHERAPFADADAAVKDADAVTSSSRAQWTQQAALYHAQLAAAASEMPGNATPAASAAASAAPQGVPKKEPASTAAASAAVAAGLPDEEELEDLIHFLRRRRPRRKSDE
ncbi:hypothetical protein Vretifemale_13673 [Volvox reticuliferus]|uniref:Hflx-type G domain-containing protein n=3 Tax=Volvox reticuliferus TaxID=1737510 RepID=A0A8J4CKK1_9CHLO|nr:hypothetical protein Vretifemale_13673 [Volvox reticuliferus]